MPTKFDPTEITAIVQNALDHAEVVWGRHRVALEAHVRKSFTMDSAMQVATNIPGFEFIKANQEKVATFIALVADIRESSDHLTCAISTKKAKVSELERVYYETSALLPALECTIQYEGGAVTEYLGDGILALFRVDDADKSAAIYAAHRAAKNCLLRSLEIVNDELASRYDLPPLQVGIGLAMSPALISLVGMPDAPHPKAIGRCVYYATKLSAGYDEIVADETLEREWPTKTGGTLRFIPCVKKKIPGFTIYKKSKAAHNILI